MKKICWSAFIFSIFGAFILISTASLAQLQVSTVEFQVTNESYGNLIYDSYVMSLIEKIRNKPILKSIENKIQNAITATEKTQLKKQYRNTLLQQPELYLIKNYVQSINLKNNLGTADSTTSDDGNSDSLNNNILPTPHPFLIWLFWLIMYILFGVGPPPW